MMMMMQTQKKWIHRVPVTYVGSRRFIAIAAVLNVF